MSFPQFRSKPEPAELQPTAGGAVFTLTAESGSLAISGTVASLEYNRLLSAESGSFTITGIDANLVAPSAEIPAVPVSGGISQQPIPARRRKNLTLLGAG